jgi:CHAT domain-containing protein
VGISESIRGGVTDPELRASFRAHRGSHYALYVEALMTLHQRDPSGGFDVQALEASERSRARSLIEMLSESSIDLRRDLSAAQRQREDGILDRINQAQRGLFRARLTPARKREASGLLAAAERDLGAFQLELRKSDSRYAAVQYAGALDEERIRREVLGPDTALVEFALGEKRSYVWVLTRSGHVSAVLPPRKQIELRVETYRKELAQGASALTVRRALARLDALGAELYRELLAPVDIAFRSAHHLIIVPDGVLAYLPFDTLGTGSKLIERYAISYSPSASVLATLRGRLQESGPPEKKLLAFGDASYLSAGVGSERNLDWTQLPQTRTEVNAIGALFPGAGSRVYLGAEASEDRVKSESLNQYRFIHFAVHGYYDEEHPARSGIALSVGSTSRQDGLLQVPEIMRLRLRADMVTLSACQTGLGKLVDGEGVMGMSRAFLYAGAGSVLISLWNVNDASTAELMKLAYQNLTRGIPRDEALRAAKLQLMRGPQSAWRHPYYWAPFILLGDSTNSTGAPDTGTR